MQTQNQAHELADRSPSSIDSFFELVEARLAAAEAAKSGHNIPVETGRCA